MESLAFYCAFGKITGAFLTGKTWNIPEYAQKPDRANKKVVLPTTLLEVLSAERRAKLSGGIYHKVQIELTYNSNHIEGSRLTHDQTRYIKCIDMIIKNTKKPITETFIKELHRTLKSGTTDARQDWFAVGDYKRLPNTVGDMFTAQPEEVAQKMKELLSYMSRHHEDLEKSFTDEQKEIFEKFHDCWSEYMSLGEAAIFKYAFKLGMQIAIETLTE